MPLPRRSKRLKICQELSITSSNNTTPSDVPVNTKGLSILPDELYLEIISYYPVTPIPSKGQYPLHDPYIDVKSQNIRRRTLFSLSQTSVNLRRFFLRYLWQRIELCKTPMKARALALELIRQLEIVTIREPTLAKYAEIVNIEIGIYSRDSVLAELARCLALLPNLHTVQLKVEEDTNIRPDALVFKDYIYPSIRTAIVSCNTMAFLRSCPESRQVDSYEINFYYRYYSWNFWDTIVHSCPHLEIAPRNTIIPVDKLPAITKALPGIRNLTLRQNQLFNAKGHLILSVVAELTAFKRLQTLTIIDIVDTARDVKDSPASVCYRTTKKLLLDLQRTDKEDKLLLLIYLTGERRLLKLKFNIASLC